MYFLFVCLFCNCRFTELSVETFDCDRRMDYMKGQSDITAKMRLILLDWLIEVHRKFALLQPTLFLCINLLDRYLSIENVHRSKLQLTGCCSMWMASKYHEIYAPEINDFVYISDNAFGAQDLIDFEQIMLTKLNFGLTIATPLSFAERYIQVALDEYKKHIYPTVYKAQLVENDIKGKRLKECRFDSLANMTFGINNINNINSINDNNNSNSNSNSNSNKNHKNKDSYHSMINFQVRHEDIRKCKRDERIIENLVYYLIEHCLMDYQLSLLMPSKIACACLAYTLLGTKLQQWVCYLFIFIVVSLFFFRFC